MTKAKRTRGRPLGASRLNASDATILAQMAETIDLRPMPPTTAMRQLGIEDQTTQKRLRRKWKASGPALLQTLTGRRHKEQLQIIGNHFFAFPFSSEILTASQAISREMPFLDANSELAKTIRDAQAVLNSFNDQMKKVAEQAANNPLSKLIAEIANAHKTRQQQFAKIAEQMANDSLSELITEIANTQKARQQEFANMRLSLPHQLISPGD